jgi:hypothetical protein
LLRAYFDVSGSGNEGLLSVAGIAFGEGQEKKANKAWKALWGDTICHWTDLNARSGDFDGWTDEQAGQRCIDAIAIIRKYATFAVVVSCDLAEAKAIAPKNLEPFEKAILSMVGAPYSVCFHLAMNCLGNELVAKSPGKSRIAYIIEEGDNDQRYLSRFMKVASSNALSCKDYCLQSFTFMRKGEARLLEAADVLAWEWVKQQKREKVGLPMRPSLIALLGERDNRRRFDSNQFHLTGEALKAAYANIEELRPKLKVWHAEGGDFGAWA